MLEFRASGWAEFSAGHRVPNHPVCGAQHGHRWRVSVTIRAGQDPTTGVVVGSYELAQAVRELAAEVEHADVNAMFPGSPPTLEGVALAFRERLSLAFGTIEEVTAEWVDEHQRVLVR